MKDTIKYLVLSLIILLAFFLRIYRIDSIPPALTWDEAAWGYNAYSLSLDGKDEFGRFLPLDHLESFGDFKPPLYAYLTVIPLKIFGLNEFTVRFPSALFGTLTVLVTFFLVKELFVLKNQDYKNIDYIALCTALILAISPWHLNLSRAAFEANVATFFIVTGVWLFFAALRRNPGYLVLAALSFILALYTFNTARIIVPLMVLVLAFAYRKTLYKFKKQTLLAGLCGIILLLPLIPFLLSPQARLRYQEVNIFSDISVIERSNRQINNDGNALWSKLIHNRRLAYGAEFLRHYFDNLSPNFLFIRGDGNPKFSTQDVGQMYLWELPFLLGGILLLFRSRPGKWWFIPVWLVIALIPAATARETPHALRIAAALPTFQILTAFGLVNFGSLIAAKIKDYKTRYLLISCFLLIVLFSFATYLSGYYTFYSREYSGEWQYGYKEAVNYISANYHKYDRIFVTEELGRPYIYFLFHTAYDPVKFRSNAVVDREALGFVHVRQFAKYEFSKDIDSIPIRPNEKILYLDVPQNIPPKADKLHTFNLLNSKPSLVAYILK